MCVVLSLTDRYKVVSWQVPEAEHNCWEGAEKQDTRGRESTPGWDATLTERDVLLVTEAEPLRLASHVCGSDEVD